MNKIHDERFASIGYRLFITNVTAAVMAGIFSGIATVTVVIGRGAAVLEQIGWTLSRLYGFYFISALVAGTVVGAVLPLARFRWGAAALGWIAGTIVFGLLFLTADMRSLEQNVLDVLLFSAVPGAIIGMPLALYFWTHPQKQRPS